MAGERAVHECDKGPVIEMMHEATQKIFTKLDDMSKVLQDVALQKKDIEHMAEEIIQLKQEFKEEVKAIDARMTAFEQACQERHSSPPATLTQKIVHAAAISIASAAAVGVFFLFVYIGYSNFQDYINFTRQTNSPGKVKH